MNATELRARHSDGLRAVAATAQRIESLGFVTSCGGNISQRLGEDVVAITPTMVPKRKVTEDDVCLIDLAGATLSAMNGRRPTGETPFHTHLYRQRPDIRGLVHAHPPVLTGFAIASSPLLSRPTLPEVILEVGPLALVEYKEPLTDDLARAFDKPLERHNGFIMKNHGVVFMGVQGCEQAGDILEMLEAAAQSLLAARQLGQVNELTREEVKALDNTMRTRKLPYPGRPGAVSSLVELYF